MSGSDPRVRLEVVARDRASQVVVIDSSLAPVARGIRSLSTELPPGIYKARVITAGQVREQFAVLEEGKAPVRLEFQQIEFDSPAPLKTTARSSSQHMEAADEHSRKVHADLHGDSQLFFFVRGPSAEQLVAGATLAGADGKTLVSFDQAGARGGDSEPWYACNVALAPGAYRLIADTGKDRLAQTVVASKGWQTQVFLQREQGVLNLGDASMFVVQAGRGFHPSEDVLRVTELARIGLSNRRQILSPEDMAFMVDGKLEDPMLGLFAAHLLLLQQPVDGERLRKIVQNLRGMLGAHPDVEALELATAAPGEPRALQPIRHPPMLARSYWLIVERSASHPELVPSGSILAEIATRLWGGAGPWLVFSEPEPSSPSEAVPAAAGAPSLEELVRQLRGYDLRRLAANPAALSSLEEAVLRYVLQRSRHGGAAIAHFDQGRMVRMLGLPPSVLRDALFSLLAKAQQLPAQERRPAHGFGWQGRWARAAARAETSAADASFPLGVERLERAVLRCARRQDKGRAWADLEMLETQVKDAFLSRRSFTRLEELLPQWRPAWGAVRSQLDTSALQGQLARNLPSRMASSHAEVHHLLRTSRLGSHLGEEPGTSLWDVYDVWEAALERYRRRLPAVSAHSRHRKRAEKKRLIGSLGTVLLGLKAISASLRMGEAGASTFWLGSRAIHAVMEELER